MCKRNYNHRTHVFEARRIAASLMTPIPTPLPNSPHSSSYSEPKPKLRTGGDLRQSGGWITGRRTKKKKRCSSSGSGSTDYTKVNTESKTSIHIHYITVKVLSTTHNRKRKEGEHTSHRYNAKR